MWGAWEPNQKGRICSVELVRLPFWGIPDYTAERLVGEDVKDRHEIDTDKLSIVCVHLFASVFFSRDILTSTKGKTDAQFPAI